MTKPSKIIFRAIKSSDRSYFFRADYHTQTANVLKELKTAGYVILPRKLTTGMISAGAQAINLGTQRPSDLVKEIYEALISFHNNTKSDN